MFDEIKGKKRLLVALDFTELTKVSQDF